MPRLKKTDAQRRAERFEKLYQSGKASSGLTDAQCATIAGVCSKTLYNERKDPIGKITIGQLSQFGKVFGWSDEDILSIIRAGN